MKRKFYILALIFLSISSKPLNGQTVSNQNITTNSQIDVAIEDYITILKSVPSKKPISISNPTHGYPTPRHITIKTSLLKSIGKVASVDFIVNGDLIGTDEVHPFTMPWTIPARGEYDVEVVAKGTFGENRDSIHIVVGTKMACQSTAADFNGAEESASGMVVLNSHGLWMGTTGLDKKTVGLRFEDMNIPQGATIKNAFIQFTPFDSTSVEPCVLTIVGERADDALPFNKNGFNITNRLKTVALVNWSPGDWANRNTRDVIETADLSAVVQEVVDRNGYSRQSALAFMVKGSGLRKVLAYDKDAENAPKLCVEYLMEYSSDNNKYAASVGEERVVKQQKSEELRVTPIPAGKEKHTAVSKSLMVSYDCPKYRQNVGATCNDNNPDTYRDVLNATCECVGSVLPPTATVFTKVAAGSDDAEEEENGVVHLSSSDLELVEEKDNQHVGLRFIHANIPAGAIILEAYIHFTTDEVMYQSPAFLEIYGEASIKSSTFVKTKWNIRNRKKTSAVVNWEPMIWMNKGEKSAVQKTTDLTSIVQELVDQDGFSSSSPLTFLIEGSGKRVAVSYNGKASEAPELMITYAHSAEEFDCESLSANVGDACNDGDPKTSNERVDENCNCIGSEIQGYACAQIATSKDDAEEKESGSVQLTSSDLELANDGTNQTIGLRFLHLRIPPGSNITTASVQFTVDETKSADPCALTIYGELQGSPEPFRNSRFNITNRRRTSTYFTWMPEEWSYVNEAGRAQQTVDIAPIIQEIISQSDYTIDSPIVIILKGEGTRTAESFDGEAKAAAKLCVEYGLVPAKDRVKSKELIVADSSPRLLAEVQKVSTLEQQVKKQEAERSKRTQAQPSLNVFPNPARDYITLRFEAENENKEATVQIWSPSGRLVHNEKRMIGAGEKELLLKSLVLPNGTYTVQLYRAPLLKAAKFVILN